MVNIKHIVAATFITTSITGCASIFSGGSDNVSINSLEKGTTLSINGAPRGLDNTAADLKRGKPYTITASKEGCKDVTIQTQESFDGRSLLGIFIDFGIFTIPIDMISGGAWKISPSSYTVTPICDKKAP